MNILDTIIEYKMTENEERKKKTSIAMLEKQPLFSRETLSLKQFLQDDSRTGIIAEFKRKSPSKGIINDRAAVTDITHAYTQHGASGLSVLTDEKFFGGFTEDLIKARVNQIPILRKDFMVDEYQIAEARAMGADVILLIAACLSPERVKELATYAQALQLEVLLEIHQEEELTHICDEVDLVGVNNRDLKTFKVDIRRSIELSRKIPSDKLKIAESGIYDIETILTFRRAGFRGFLIGENFMKQEDPAKAFAAFAAQVKMTPA